MIDNDQRISTKNYSNELIPETPLFDPYEIIQVRNEGGMGTLYIVKDPKRNWLYVVKTPKIWDPDLSIGNQTQFMAEMEYMIMLPPHPNIIQVDFIQWLNDNDEENKRSRRPYMFMEYIDGCDLHQKLANAPSGKLELDEAIGYALQICDGMSFIHEKGHFLHLDIKPENMLLDQNGILKIADFGISKTSQLLSRVTTQQRKGTYPYMSPEQICGKNVDVWSDIYSFGILFYQILTGAFPYPFQITGEAGAINLKQQLLEFHASDYDFHNVFSHQAMGEEISSEIGTIIGHCLAKHPEKRIPNFPYLKRWLEKIGGKRPSLASPPKTKVDLYRKGLNLQLIGKHSEALEYFNRSLFFAPGNVQLLNDAAVSYLALGMKTEAESLLNKLPRW
jgi:serine/threonine-protein kinase